MKYRYLVLYSVRILTREWRKYILTFFSLFLTALIVTLALSLTGSASIYLENEAKALTGGDATVESSFIVDESAFLSGSPEAPLARTRTLTFSGTVRHTDTARVAPVSFQIVDTSFPLYGTFVLENTSYTYLGNDEILIDRAAAKKLGMEVGGVLYVGEVPYMVRDIIVSEPDVLLNTFRIYPKVFLSEEGFARSQIDPALLRGEYTYAYRFRVLSDDTVSFFTDRARERNLHLHFADTNHGGFARSFDVITQFLIVAVLITALLAAVNVYASITYLLNRLRRSLAVLRAIGVSLQTVRVIVILTFVYIVVCAGVLGMVCGYGVAAYVRTLSEQFLEIQLPTVLLFEHIALVSVIVGATGIAALTPSLAYLSRVSPRALLVGDGYVVEGKRNVGLLIAVTILAYIPLLLLASFLLKSVTSGLITVASVVGVYVAVSFLYRGVVEVVYRARAQAGFTLRTILSWKRYDGLFGIISFTSLYCALTALFILALTQTSLQSFLQNDIGATVPSVYILDVQGTQSVVLKEKFETVTLFPNVSGRVISIDGVDIQRALTSDNSDIDRELRREFTLTYRTNLIQGETLIAGSDVIGLPGTVSVDSEFAERARIRLGSRIVVSVQGFPVSAEVTSLRETESRSGLPFFYFVFAPEDLKNFPTSYFGYAYMDTAHQAELLDFISLTMPNVSSIDTAEVGLFVQNTVAILVTIVFSIALPPFILACALIIVLVVLQYGARRRDGARLLALGARPRWIERQYVLETMSTTILASMGAYVTAVVATWYVTRYYLKLDMFTVYSSEIAYGLLGILTSMFIIGLLLWRTDNRPLREFLAYEENH